MKKDVKIKCELTIPEAQLVLTALSKLPLETVLPTFNNIQKQCNEQLKKISEE